MPVFDNPAALLLLLLLPLLLIVSKRFGRSARMPFPFSRLGPVASGAENQHGAPNASGPRVFIYRLSRLAFYAGLVALCLVLARPGLSHREPVYLDRGRDVIFALDASPSMAALEGGLSRFSSCVSIASDFAQAEGNANVGLVAFGSEAALIVPPTTDRAYFAQRLALLSPGDYGDGTAIGTGVVTALYHERSAAAPNRLLVLFTDGENNAGDVDPDRAAEICKSMGVTLYVVGIGSEGAVPVSWKDPKTGKVLSGEYESHYDPSSLRDMALKAGGHYLSARDPAGLKAARETIMAESLAVGRVRYDYRTDSLSREFCLLALACFALSFLCASVILEASECL
jgi:Ca-activated chloride channel homolog